MPIFGKILSIALAAAILAGCHAPLQCQRAATLAEATQGFHTHLTRQYQDGTPPPPPPENLFHLVSYKAQPGDMAAYLSNIPDDGQKHPAIIWITGGDPDSIGDVWTPQERSNDQTASAYRQAGIIMLFPSSRGGNQNPGYEEGFLGEVDDILAARDFLAAQKGVDPSRIYLGGHSTGGSMVLLTAAKANVFRAVFAFGPKVRVTDHAPERIVFDPNDCKEVQVRSVGEWISTIKTPAFILEGVGGNYPHLLELQRLSNGNPNTHFIAIQGADHFSTLAPANAVIAQKILHDTGPAVNIHIDPSEIRVGG